MIKTISVGHASYELYVQVDNFVKENDYYRFINKIGCGGGTAANVSYLLAKWGIGSTFAGTYGNDMYGNRIAKELQSVGVDTRYCETTYDKDTTVSTVIINQQNGSSTLLNIADEYVKLKKFDFDFQPDFIYIDGHDPYASKSTIERFPKAKTICGVTRNVNEVLDCARLCEYAIFNASTAQSITNIKIDYNTTNTLVAMYDSLRKKFDHQKVIVTLGDHGALYEIDNQIKVSPAIRVGVVDQTGAKDVFDGAFVYGLARDYSMEQAIRFANIAAGLSVQKVGARLSIPRLQDVQKIYDEKAN